MIMVILVVTFWGVLTLKCEGQVAPKCELVMTTIQEWDGYSLQCLMAIAHAPHKCVLTPHYNTPCFKNEGHWWSCYGYFKIWSHFGNLNLKGPWWVVLLIKHHQQLESREKALVPSCELWVCLWATWGFLLLNAWCRPGQFADGCVIKRIEKIVKEGLGRQR